LEVAPPIRAGHRAPAVGARSSSRFVIPDRTRRAARRTRAASSAGPGKSRNLGPGRTSEDRRPPPARPSGRQSGRTAPSRASRTRRACPTRRVTKNVPPESGGRGRCFVERTPARKGRLVGRDPAGPAGADEREGPAPAAAPLTAAIHRLLEGGGSPLMFGVVVSPRKGAPPMSPLRPLGAELGQILTDAKEKKTAGRRPVSTTRAGRSSGRVPPSAPRQSALWVATLRAFRDVGGRLSVDGEKPRPRAMFSTSGHGPSLMTPRARGRSALLAWPPEVAEADLHQLHFRHAPTRTRRRSTPTRAR